MGVSLHVIDRLSWLHKNEFLPRQGAILEFGSQNLYRAGDPKILSDFVRQLGGDPHKVNLTALGNGGKMAELMKLCGWSYAAVDIFRDENVTLLDLNLHDLPSEFVGRFDLVTNFGTSEHIINQLRVFSAIHEAAKEGGVIYHELPMGGYFYHGYFSYTPMFFRHLAIANDYEPLFNTYQINRSERTTSADMMENGYGDFSYCDANIEFAFRKRNSAPFRLPLEIGTSLGLDKNLWNGEIPYVVIEGRSGLSESDENFPSYEARHAPASDAAIRRALRQIVKLNEQIVKLNGEVGSLRSEFRSLKSYFGFARPLRRLFRCDVGIT